MGVVGEPGEPECVQEALLVGVELRDVVNREAGGFEAPADEGLPIEHRRHIGGEHERRVFPRSPERQPEGLDHWLREGAEVLEDPSRRLAMLVAVALD